jgi:hypothetical protein
MMNFRNDKNYRREVKSMPMLREPKRERFVQNIIAGMSQRQAYLDAYPNSHKYKEATVDNKACLLLQDADVAARYKELQEASADAAIMQRKERMIVLSEFARDEQAWPKTRMQAIDILNKMDGDYVKRIEANVTGDVSEIAAKVGAILDE